MRLSQRAWNVAAPWIAPAVCTALPPRHRRRAAALGHELEAVARRAARPRPPLRKRKGHGNNGNDEQPRGVSVAAVEHCCCCAPRRCWARCSGFHRVGGRAAQFIVCERRAYQLRDALDFLLTHRAAHIGLGRQSASCPNDDDDDDDESEENEDEDDENSNAIISGWPRRSTRGPCSNGSARRRRRRRKRSVTSSADTATCWCCCASMATSASCSYLKILHEQRKLAVLRTPSCGCCTAAAQEPAVRQKSSSELLIASPDAGGGDDEKKDSEKGGRNGYFTVTADSGALE